MRGLWTRFKAWWSPSPPLHIYQPAAVTPPQRPIDLIEAAAAKWEMNRRMLESKTQQNVIISQMRYNHLRDVPNRQSWLIVQMKDGLFGVDVKTLPHYVRSPSQPLVAIPMKAFKQLDKVTTKGA